MYVLGVDVPVIEFILSFLVLVAIVFFFFTWQLRHLTKAGFSLATVSSRLNTALQEQTTDMYLLETRLSDETSLPFDVRTLPREEVVTLDIRPILLRARHFRKKGGKLEKDARTFESLSKSLLAKGKEKESEMVSSKAEMFKELSHRFRKNAMGMLLESAKQLEARADEFMQRGNQDDAKKLVLRAQVLKRSAERILEELAALELLEKGEDLKKHGHNIVSTAYLYPRARAKELMVRGATMVEKGSSSVACAIDMQQQIITKRIAEAKQMKELGEGRMSEGEEKVSAGTTVEDTSHGVDLIWEGRQLIDEGEDLVEDVKDEFAFAEGGKKISVEEEARRLSKIDVTLTSNKKELNALTAERNALYAEIDSLAAAEEEMVKLEGEAERVEKALEAERAEVKSLSKEIPRAQKRISDLSEEKIRAHISAVEKNVALLEKSLAKKESAGTQPLKKQLAEYKRKLEESNLKEKAITIEEARLEAEADSHSAEEGEPKLEFEASERNIALAKAAVNHLEGQVASERASLALIQGGPLNPAQWLAFRGVLGEKAPSQELERRAEVIRLELVPLELQLAGKKSLLKGLEARRGALVKGSAGLREQEAKRSAKLRELANRREEAAAEKARLLRALTEREEREASASSAISSELNAAKSALSNQTQGKERVEKSLGTREARVAEEERKLAALHAARKEHEELFAKLKEKADGLRQQTSSGSALHSTRLKRTALVRKARSLDVRIQQIEDSMTSKRVDQLVGLELFAHLAPPPAGIPPSISKVVEAVAGPVLAPAETKPFTLPEGSSLLVEGTVASQKEKFGVKTAQAFLEAGKTVAVLSFNPLEESSSLGGVEHLRLFKASTRLNQLNLQFSDIVEESPSVIYANILFRLTPMYPTDKIVQLLSIMLDKAGAKGVSTVFILDPGMLSSQDASIIESLFNHVVELELGGGLGYTVKKSS
jgi:hypothetical protein